MRRSFLTSAILLVALLLTACGTQAPTPTSIVPTATIPAATATSPAATSTVPVPTATQPAALPTSTTEPPTMTTAPATPTPEPSPTTPPSPTAQPTPTVALAPGGWFSFETTGTAPAPRYDHISVLDPTRNWLVVFGGRDGGTTFADTWILDLNGKSWREVPAQDQMNSPVARFGHGAVYSPDQDAIVMVMGQSPNGFLNDVWAFDLKTERWSLIKPHHIADGEPRPRYGQSAAIDKAGRVLISHGFSDQGRFDDTWAFSFAETRWIDISAPGTRPLNRCLHDLAYDPNSDQLYLFGGCSSGYGPCPQGDLWSYNLQTQTWIEITPTGEVPAARSNTSFTLNPDTGEIFLFGGLTGKGAIGDTLRYNIATNHWSGMESEISPSPRSSQGTGINPAQRLVTIFGGLTRDGATNDVWQTGF